MINLTEDIQSITDLIASYLKDGKDISEYDLIRWLQSSGNQTFTDSGLKDSLTLFRTHFLVMHCLYQLRLSWLNSGQGFLKISALSIQLQAVTISKEYGLDKYDPLADYYLNLDELTTDRDEIDKLLNQFWEAYLSPDEIIEDLNRLGLDSNATPTDIRCRYRELAQQHHPDKGGNAEDFRAIISAYQRLKRKA